MCGKFIWHLTENMNRGAVGASRIELQGVKSKFLKF